MKVLLICNEEPNSGGLIKFVEVLSQRLNSLGHQVGISQSYQDGHDLYWFHSLPSPNDFRFEQSDRILFHIHDYRYTCLTSRKAIGEAYSPCHKALSGGCFLTHTLSNCGRGRNPIKLLGAYSKKKNWLKKLQRVPISVLSHYLKRELISNQINETDISVMPMIHQCFESSRRERNVDELNLLWVGRLIKEKGTDKLIELIQRHREWPPHFQLRIIGIGTEESILRELLNRYGLKDKVTMTSGKSYEEMSSHYRWATALLYTSLWPEPFGMVGPEALSAGLRVYNLSPNVAGASEWINQYQKFCVNVESIKSFIDQIKTPAYIRESDFLQLPEAKKQLAELSRYLAQLGKI